MENIVYTKHLKTRMKLRRIPEKLPYEIYKTAKRKYYDNVTNNFIALKMIEYVGKRRNMAVTYIKTISSIKIITIHPLKRHQLESRIQSGRWIKV